LHFVRTGAFRKGKCRVNGCREFSVNEQACNPGVGCGESWRGAAHQHDAAEGGVSRHEIAREDGGGSAASDNESGAFLGEEAEIGTEVILCSGFDE
jgi:hypothetical protein